MSASEGRGEAFIEACNEGGARARTKTLHEAVIDAFPTFFRRFRDAFCDAFCDTFATLFRRFSRRFFRRFLRRFRDAFTEAFPKLKKLRFCTPKTKENPALRRLWLPPSACLLTNLLRVHQARVVCQLQLALHCARVAPCSQRICQPDRQSPVEPGVVL